MALALPAAPRVARGDEAPPDSSHDGAASLFLVLGFCLGVVGPGFVMSTLGFLLQGRLETGEWLGFASAATLTGAVLAVRFALDTLAAGPLMAWIALDRVPFAEVGLLLGAAFYAVALLVAWLGFNRVR
jgi:hypothetical protein